jgi:hypothetical protein
MTTDEQRTERITWLNVEFEEVLERFLHGDIDAQQLAQLASGLSSYEEVDKLGSELLQHSFWAMQHVTHRPACWAPTRQEIEYLLLCIREEEVFDPERIDFAFPLPRK